MAAAPTSSSEAQLPLFSVWPTPCTDTGSSPQPCTFVRTQPCTFGSTPDCRTRTSQPSCFQCSCPALLRSAVWCAPSSAGRKCTEADKLSHAISTSFFLLVRLSPRHFLSSAGLCAGAFGSYPAAHIRTNRAGNTSRSRGRNEQARRSRLNAQPAAACLSSAFSRPQPYLFSTPASSSPPGRSEGAPWIYS